MTKTKTKIKSKIREIIEKYSTDHILSRYPDPIIDAIESKDFDKLEKELIDFMMIVIERSEDASKEWQNRIKDWQNRRRNSEDKN